MGSCVFFEICRKVGGWEGVYFEECGCMNCRFTVAGMGSECNGRG